MFSIQFSNFQIYCQDQLGLSHHSIRAYQQDLNTFQKFIDNENKGQKPTAECLINFHRYLREKIKSSPATIRRRLITLKSYFYWLENNNTEPSPFKDLKLNLKIAKRLPKPIDRQTLAILFQFLKNNPNSNKNNTHQTSNLLIRLLVVTGLRIGEITHLRIKDISYDGSTIKVLGKGSRERTVYIANKNLLNDLINHKQKIHKTYGVESFLFLNSNHKRLTEVAFRKRLKKLSQFLNIKPIITPHQFRHSAATLLIEEGIDIRFVQRLLGHASIATTEIYTKVSDNSLLAAIQKANILKNFDS